MVQPTLARLFSVLAVLLLALTSFPLPAGQLSKRDKALRALGEGTALLEEGDYVSARKVLMRSVDLWRELAKMPTAASEDRVTFLKSLNTLAVAFQQEGDSAAAGLWFLEAVDVARRLYSGKPHAAVAITLNNLGHAWHQQGDLQRSLPALTEALKMERTLHAQRQDRRTMKRLSVVLTNVGLLLRDMGERVPAMEHLKEALALRQMLAALSEILLVKDEPSALVQLATAMGNVALIHGDWEEHNDECRQAATVLKFMDGAVAERTGKKVPVALATAVHNYGAALCDAGEAEQAVQVLERSVDLHQRIYPQGHPRLASTLLALGCALDQQGDFNSAMDYYCAAQRMQERLYPEAAYPLGHPERAAALQNLGAAWAARGQTNEALDALRDGLAMQYALARRYADAASEAETLNYLARLPRMRDAYLSLSLASKQLTDGEVYKAIWPGRAMASQVLTRPRPTLVGPLKDLHQDLLSVRRQLAQALLTPVPESAQHRQRVKLLTAHKEQLERGLGGAPRSGPPVTAQHLAQRLPRESAFIEIIRYQRLSPVTQKRKAIWLAVPHYVAFIVVPGKGEIKRVELGPAERLEELTLAWGFALRADLPNFAGGLLREKLWQPIAMALPEKTTRLYVVPDGGLARLPWAALPSRPDGRVLLEDYEVAVVPHGEFLHNQLARDADADIAGPLLALAGVKYERMGVAPPPPTILGMRPAQRLGAALKWDALPGTEKEVKQILDLAASRKKQHLQGEHATTVSLVEALPKARWVHLATHGFFASHQMRSAFHLEESNFNRPLRERVDAGLRNPLVLSGLVLAGANHRDPRREGWLEDDGVVTGEAIAGMRLENLRLVTLSACDTGIGEVGGGEGVFGLQRAFHLAGASNVVASLWRVDDEATAALMAVYYHKLWRDKKSPLTALREAQLTIYYDPASVPAWSRGRDLDLANPVPLPTGKGGVPPPLPKNRAPARAWAGFVLSGAGY